MPTPERTSLDEIVGAAREILEADGLARLTMQAVAERVGVRAPSLYKRVRNREALIQLVASASVDDLGARLGAVVRTGDPRADLASLARAFRAFAHARPAAYRLIMAWSPEVVVAVDVERLAQASAPMLEVSAQLAGPGNALEAARLVTAWGNGFINMELAGAFKLGGDVEEAFEYGIERLARALAL
ncbi:AcrR family transcriptional regulator [Actinoplanes lutulentus]|uniref:TetR family transcriptional regulator n=1 Tax=Actinoplanes lutulentus TaxID=1287878 RepID=A0A327ZC65_9ACTN|nr:TetR/AcrR family transcriptional regulator [Actinoplanes lutulentus]MBB2946797.1 AcrR family transcriptional regulator [Actinoplanes lutulentus]RAK35689.1 TetR family transcriptional regulator [Actinoplanes lutulentus]